MDMKGSCSLNFSDLELCVNITRSDTSKVNGTETDRNQDLHHFWNQRWSLHYSNTALRCQSKLWQWIWTHRRRVVEQAHLNITHLVWILLMSWHFTCSTARTCEMSALKIPCCNNLAAIADGSIKHGDNRENISQVKCFLSCVALWCSIWIWLLALVVFQYAR